MVKEYQIAQLLSVAKEQLTYCQIIINYPSSVGKKNFDVTAPKDKFYKTVCNMAFNEGLLIIGSLLDKKYNRTISLWNFEDFIKHKQLELKNLTSQFLSSGLKTIRDEIVAHQDTDNENNNFPNFRRRGIIEPKLVKLLYNLLDEIIKEFRDYAKNFSTSYSNQYFDIENAKNEIETVLDQAKPNLTDDFII